MTGTTARGNITDVLLSCMCNVKTSPNYVWTKMKLKYSPQLFKGWKSAINWIDLYPLERAISFQCYYTVIPLCQNSLKISFRCTSM